ncbi:MAG: LamG domain-containing protein [Smithella sp.]
MKKTLSILFSVLLTVQVFAQSQISELQKGLIFSTKLDEWGQGRDEISGTMPTKTDVYNVLSKDGSGRRCLEYNGTSSYTTLPTIPAFGTGDFTITGKIKTGALGAIRTIIGGAANSFELYISATGYLTALKYGGSALTASTTLLTANTEYTFAYVRSSTTGTYYVNGIAAGTCTDSNNYSVTCTLAGNGTGYFNGSISMVRIFNYALDNTTVGSDGLTELQRKSRPEHPIEWVDRGATGAELITNTADRDFSSDTGFWSIGGSGISITAGVARWSISSAYAELRRVSFVVIGKKYRIMYDIPTRTSGSIFCNIGVDGIVRSTTGTAFKDELIATNTTLLWGAGAISSTLDVDNVSVTQLGCLLDLNAEGMSSATWVDKTNNLTATNSGTTLVVPPASDLSATRFNGSTSKLVYTGMNALTGITSISAQIHPIALGGFIFDNTKVKLKVNSSGYLSFSRDGSTYVNSGAGSIAINTIYNILVTSTAIGVTNFYINNVLSGTANQAAGTPSGGTTWNIGTDATNFYSGSMKNLHINGELFDLDRIKLLNDIQ